jgi:hypothetical protein
MRRHQEAAISVPGARFGSFSGERKNRNARRKNNRNVRWMYRA